MDRQCVCVPKIEWWPCLNQRKASNWCLTESRVWRWEEKEPMYVDYGAGYLYSYPPYSALEGWPVGIKVEASLRGGSWCPFFSTLPSSQEKSSVGLGSICFQALWLLVASHPWEALGGSCGEVALSWLCPSTADHCFIRWPLFSLTLSHFPGPWDLGMLTVPLMDPGSSTFFIIPLPLSTRL